MTEIEAVGEVVIEAASTNLGAVNSVAAAALIAPPCVASSGIFTAVTPLIVNVPETVVTAPIAIVFAGLTKLPPVAIVLSAPKCPSEPVAVLVIVTTAEIEGTELANTFATPETVRESAESISESYNQVNEVAHVAVT